MKHAESGTTAEPKPWLDLAMLDQAMAIAVEVHGQTMRKGGTIPYLSHVWSVAALVLEHGGDNAQLAAALLHDTAEDGTGHAMIDRLDETFHGTDVADLVEHLSDSLVDVSAGKTKEDWWTRKSRYIAGLAMADDRVLLVSACDKLHNARCILADHRVLGPGLWLRFNNRDAAAHAWYYATLAGIFLDRVPVALTGELRRTVDELVGRLRDGEMPDVDERIAAYNAETGQP